MNPLALLEWLMSRPDRSSRWIPLLLAVIAVGYRLFLTSRYYGWEESDYGNLAMTRGVLESGFLDYDMRHLPFYYFLSALVLLFVRNTIVATHLVSLAAGTIAVVLAYKIAQRAFDERTARVTGLLLCFQPEFALYASSSLRDPLFTCLALAGCYLLLKGSPRGAAVATGFSFLTRFDSLGTNMPAMVLHLIRRPPRLFSRRHPLWIVVLILAGFVAAWSIYCGQVHGTYLFFGQTVQMNVDTGGARELGSKWDFVRHGLEISSDMFFGTMPHHLGPLCWGLAVLGMMVHRHELLAKTAKGTVFTYLALNTLFWLAVGFVAQHEPEHNLYWIWMNTLIAYWCMYAASGVSYIMAYVLEYIWFSVPLSVILSLGLALPFIQQTQFQIDQSAQLYRPQVELAQWIEAHVPPHTSMLLDNIPERYISRNVHDWRLISWMDLQVEPANEAAFAHYLLQEKIRYVLWFKEDWTQAPNIAPFLAELRPHRVGRLNLVPIFHEEQYGFIFYRVDADGGVPL